VTRRTAAVSLSFLLALAACDSKTSGSAGGTKVAESGTLRGSAGGFSAQMANEMAKAGIGEALAPTPAEPAAPPAPTPTPSTSTTAPTPASSDPVAPPSPSAGTPPSPSTGAGTTATPIEPAMTATGAVKAPAARPYMKPTSHIPPNHPDPQPNWGPDNGEGPTGKVVERISGMAAR